MKILDCFEQIKTQLINAGWNYDGLCYLKDDSHDFTFKVGYEEHLAGELVNYDRKTDVNVVLNVNFKTKGIEVLYGRYIDNEFYHRCCIGGSMLLMLCNNTETIINNEIAKMVVHVTNQAKLAPVKYPRIGVINV